MPSYDSFFVYVLVCIPLFWGFVFIFFRCFSIDSDRQSEDILIVEYTHSVEQIHIVEPLVVAEPIDRIENLDEPLQMAEGLPSLTEEILII